MLHLTSAGPSAPPTLRATSSRVSDADCDDFFPNRHEPHVNRAKSSGAVLRTAASARAANRPPPPGAPPSQTSCDTAAVAGESAPCCIICYDEFDRRRAPHRIPCPCQEAHYENHAYVHYGCIRAWAAQKSSCPLCRAALTVQCNAFVAPAGVELADFVQRPLPIDAGVVQCFVRVRLGLGAPVYDLFLEGPPSQRLHLLTATWKLERGLRSSYVVSLPADGTRAHPEPIARVLSNFLGTCWSVLSEKVPPASPEQQRAVTSSASVGPGARDFADARPAPPHLGGGRVASSVSGGLGGGPAHRLPSSSAAAELGECGAPSPASDWRREDSSVGCSTSWRRRRSLRVALAKSFGGSSAPGGRAELAAVGYKANRFCLDSGPRTMSLATPAVTEDGEYEGPRLPTEAERKLAAALPCARSGAAPPAHVTAFKNRAPVWDDRYEAYVLNFLGRVRVASVKNFQVVQTDNVANETLLQFGRVSSTVFSMDVQWPFSVVQAFGICLTSISTKLGVK